jgi:hypothetical protein
VNPAPKDERVGSGFESAYDLTPSQVEQALAFYGAHRAELDAAIAVEQELEGARA